MLATDPLSLVFIGCAVFSGAFLVISTLLGAGGSHFSHLGGLHSGHADSGSTAHAAHATDGHAMHGAHAQTNGTHADGNSAQTLAAPSHWASISDTLLGALNLYGLLMFLLIFGLVGYVAHAVLGWGVLFVIVVPLLFGVACAIGLTTLLHLVFATSKDTVLTTTDARLEGRLGTVTMAIRAGGTGEIVFTRKGGGRQSVGARSAGGEAISAGSEVVILDYQGGIASVQSWDDFMVAVRTGNLPELAPMEGKPPRLPPPEVSKEE
jgi:membrane protein implicated in regulation of membrane protease activity